MADLFSGEFEPERWRGTIWAITSVFESGLPNGNPAAFQNSDAGIISFGRHQATLGSGALGRVVEAFLARSQSPVATALRAEFSGRIRNRDATLRNNSRLRELLISAATEEAMLAAQDEVFARDYYQPVVEQAPRWGVRSPLGLAILYDTHVQGGLFIVAEAVARRLGGSGIGRVGVNGIIDEPTWIRTFLGEREARLHRLADQAEATGRHLDAQALRTSTFRVRELRKLVDAGNWGLVGEFLVRGQRVAGLPQQNGSETADVALRPNAQFVSFRSSADLGELPEGSSFSATWRVRNTGNSTWDETTEIVHINSERGSQLMAVRDRFL